LYEPQSVSTIAEQALVSEELAEAHLNRLAEDAFVIEVERDSGEARYRRSSESVTQSIDKSVNMLEWP
jgi:chaperonin cofactor prefoldin